MRGSATSPRRFFVPGGRCGEYLRRRADARLQSALQLSIRTTDRSLKEVERLKAQRRRLARHCLDFRDRLKVATSIIESIEMAANGSLVKLLETKREARHLQEENEHLRADASELIKRLRQLNKSIDADSESVREETWGLARDLRIANAEVVRLRGQRKILARHLRKSIKKARAFDGICQFIDTHFSFWWPLNVCWDALLRTGRKIARCCERALLTPLFGRRGAREVQGALDG